MNVKTVSPVRVVRFLGESQVRYTFQQRPAFGKWMKTELVSLGPAFIKLGQFLSTRPDILGKEVTAELANLQDNIINTPFEDIKHVVEESLGQPLVDVFNNFETTAIASASIGQVHIAYLKKNNQKVAVKVQKPNVATLIKEDLATLKNLNNVMMKLKYGQAKEIDRILLQYEKFLSGELDYLKELEQMRRFKKLLEEQPVYIPGVYASMSTAQVLVMEYIESIKITNVDQLRSQGADLGDIARRLIAVFIYQMTTSGYIHCDPHPGNLGIKLDGAEPTIVLYDFGNVVQFSRDFRMSIAEIIFAVYQKDINEFVSLLVKLNVIEVDNQDDIYEIKEFFAYFFNYLESLDIESLKTNIRSGDITGSFQDNLKINPDFLSLFRIFSLLDGTCSLLDTSFNYIQVLQPFTEGMMQDVTFLDMRARKDITKLREYPTIIQSTDGNVTRMKKKMQTISTKLQETQIIAGVCVLLHDKVEVGYILVGLLTVYIWSIYKDSDSKK